LSQAERLIQWRSAALDAAATQSLMRGQQERKNRERLLNDNVIGTFLEKLMAASSHLRA